MADISREIQDFRDAVYGEEVRGSMISLAEKVNTESTDAKTAAVKSASDAGAAASNASYAVTQANAAVQSANKAAQNIQDKADRGDFTSTIQIGEVTTGEPGTEASASNSGTPKDAVIDLTIPQGYQGVSMRMAGTWTAGTEYVNNTSYIDLVTYNGSTYGCKQSHTASEAILPTNEGYWQVIAKKGDTGSVENIDSVPITFKEAEERENVETGDTITTVFGKVKKWFSSFKQAAFYDVVNNVLQTEPGQKVLDAAVGKYLDEKKFDISRLVANRNITEPGFAMDGKTLVEWLNELNGNMEQTYRLSGGIQLPEGANFDNYQTPGNYYFTNSAIAGTMTNIPIFEAGVLKVEDSLGNGNSYMAQTYLPYARSAIFMRAKIYNPDGTYLWTSWLRYITTSDFSIESIPVNTGLICYKFGKIVMANITKEITLVVGWNTLSTAVPETINRTFGVCGTSDGVTFGMISVSGTTLQVEFPNGTAGKTITVRGSIVYSTK